MTHIIGVYGAGGCGRGIMPLFQDLRDSKRLVFIDDNPTTRQVNSYDVLTWVEFLEAKADNKRVCLAVASPVLRSQLAERCARANIPLASARAQSVVQMDDVIVGEGSCLSPFVTLTVNIKIGRSFHANLYAYVEHDCRIGDFVTLAPGAKVNGNVEIGDLAYIGAGAVIKQGVKIGSRAIVGMGAIVTRDVAPGTTVVGNPARPIG